MGTAGPGAARGRPVAVLGAALVLVRLAGRQQSKMPYIAAVPLAVYTVTHFIPSRTSVAAVSFVVFSVVMLWFAAIMIRASQTTCA